MKKEDVAVAALGVVFPTGLLAKQLYDLASAALENPSSGSKTVDALAEAAATRELEQRIEQANARIAQEYAIAARISESAEVEIEEHYEYASDIKGGVSGNVQTGDVSVGGSGASQRVSRRIYRFTGRAEMKACSEAA